MKTIIQKGLLGCAALVATAASAQNIYVGTHVGAMGSSDESSIGFGAQLGVNPGGVASFQVDATFTPVDAGTYFSTSPAVVLYPVAQEEFTLGMLGGAGFYKPPGHGVLFGLNFGVSGDFRLSEAMKVGLEARYHPIFGEDNLDLRSVFITLKYFFDNGSDW